MNKLFECPNCDHGYVPLEEDGGLRYDGCYHCGTTGYVSYNPNPSDDEINRELQEIANERSNLFE